jgi:H+/Cl- antiporter ClcA
MSIFLIVWAVLGAYFYIKFSYENNVFNFSHKQIVFLGVVCGPIVGLCTVLYYLLFFSSIIWNVSLKIFEKFWKYLE